MKNFLLAAACIGFISLKINAFGQTASCAKNVNNQSVKNIIFNVIEGVQFSPDTIKLGLIASGCVEHTQLPLNQNYFLKPLKNTHTSNGVTTFDMLLISKHILGTTPFTSPYQWIAADINRSGSITTFDIVEMRKLILGLYQNFPNNTSWRFIPENFNFPNPSNPFQTAFPESLPMSAFQNGARVDFIAVKVGDVNNTADPNLFAGEAEDRARLPLTLENRSLRAGEVAAIPVFAADLEGLEGLQFSLRFDPRALEIAGLESSALAGFSGNDFFQPEPGLLNLSWIASNAVEVATDEPLFSLKIKALQPLNLHDVLAFDDKNLRAEVYDASERQFNLDLIFQEKNTGIGQAIFSPLQPNPASETAVFQLNLPEKTAVRWEVFDLSGRKLLEETLEAEAGSRRFEVPVTRLKNAGLYGYRVRAGGEAWSGRFLKN